MPTDTLGRPLEDLRISVTDRCNYRCRYCMPHEHYTWVRHGEVLTFEEITRLARLLLDLGVRRIRLTGGEPLVRADLGELVGMLAGLDGLEDLSLTTNGALLAPRAGDLRAAGLRRLNISLDTLRPEVFRALTQRDDLARVLEGIVAARAAGFEQVKLNCVVQRGVNDGEIPDLVRFARAHDSDIRFIEFMDVGTANSWSADRLVPAAEILERVRTLFPLEPTTEPRGNAPSESWRFKDGRGRLGVIASVTAPFCGSCRRARLTAEGRLVTCLFAASGTDLKDRLRGGAGDEEIREAIRQVWAARVDRYSEERFTDPQHLEGYRTAGRDRLEMIRLGG
jgi:cyclic pyranopterin phosphate synthase